MSIEKHFKKEEEIHKEAIFGIAPVLKKEKIYGFMDAFLVLAGYCIATWSYTQGAYLATLVGFKQLLIGAFLGGILMLVIYQLPVILSVRYGIDIWIWLRGVFGTKGVKIVTVIIILINFPWYAVCADLFASSMENILSIFGIRLPGIFHVLLGISCVLLGLALAFRGIRAITKTTRVLVPLLLIIGVFAAYIGFSSVPFQDIWNYTPQRSDNSVPNIIPYIISIEANFAFVITLLGGMSGVPRLTKKESAGLWSGVLGQGLAGSFFVVVGAIVAIAMEQATGVISDDPTLMFMKLSIPILGLSSLFLVAFANIGTQGVGLYIYGVMLKSTFKKTSYNTLIICLSIFVIFLVIWGKIIKYFGSFLTLSAAIYAPIAALLFVDFFFVRKGKLDFRSAFDFEGHNSYRYTNGFNLIGFFCVIVGVIGSFSIYNPLSGQVHNLFLFHLTPTGFSFLLTGILYFVLSKIPKLRKYILQDRNGITV